jgi:hypothetical protein
LATAASTGTAAHSRSWFGGRATTIELEGRYQRGRGSVGEYLEQTAIANMRSHPIKRSGRQDTL